MNVEILYFAAARDVTGQAREVVELPSAVIDIGGFICWLVQCYPDLEPHQRSLRIAKNETFAEARELLAEHDVLAVIPPVAGG